MRIGILGGTFNPVHLGHLILAEEAREKLGLDKIIFVPAYLPAHKKKKGIVSAFHRYQMLKLAIKGNKHFSVSDFEIKKKGISYTIDTIRHFMASCSSDRFYFITGSDLLKYLDEWKDLSDIIRMVKFVVATRPGYPLEKIPDYIRTVPIRSVDISAFEVRDCIRKGKSFRYLVPEQVFDYIKANKIYS
ncbi:MAG: nicotinate-nucleotide adenylyltransferase [Candidatus Omnitrophica bacterium]|jgi:nicotinate-nucleotide adenylyltransferase|nr:nicotinate-nucleotide adenylyltransferase [Candidatus Omnitrophota bacterium]